MYCTRWHGRGLHNWPWSQIGDSCCKRTRRGRRHQQHLMKKRRLHKRKLEFENAEGVLETEHAVKQIALGYLGKCRSRGGGVDAKKRRWEVLDRVVRLGQGLSPEQRNDFSWFKEAWDARMLQGNGGQLV